MRRAARAPRRRASASTSGSSTRPLNVDLSGGEKKRNETLQLGVLRPKIAVLDELDSGLDVDALRAVRPPDRGRPPNETGLGVLAITHYSRLLHELRADVVHILVRGEIRRHRRPRAGRASSRRPATPPGRPPRTSRPTPAPSADPFADPFGPGPFAE